MAEGNEQTVPTDKGELIRIISTLEAERILPVTTAELWKKQVRSGEIAYDHELVEKTRKFVTSIRPRSGSNASIQEKVSRTEEVLMRLDLDTGDTKDWEAANLGMVDRFMNWGSGLFETAGEGIENMDAEDMFMELMTFGAYVSPEARERRDADKAAQPPDFSDHKVQFVKQLLADKVINDKQYKELNTRFSITSDEKSLGGILEQLSDWGVTDEVLDSTLQESTTAVWRRENRQAQLVEDQARLDAEEESLMDDDQKLKRRRQFERLDSEFPGRYVWNADNGYMYEVGTGQLVDENGDYVTSDRDGNLPEGYAQDTEFWDDAIDIEQPWAESGVDADTYYDLYDVVQNPDRYHAGGLERFTSGEKFLGGFDSDWGVAQDAQVQQAQFNERYGERPADRMNAGYGMDGTYTRPQMQEVRRPWYDPKDNWALYAGKSSEAVRQDQEWLIEIGALSADDITDGEWGSSEADAIELMMIEANGKAERLDDIDFDFWTEFWEDENKGGSAAQRRKFVAPAYRKLDPANIQLTIEETVRRQLGRDASQDELAELGQHMADMHRQSFAMDVTAMEAEYDATTRAIDTDTRQSAGEVEDIDHEARFMQAFNEKNAAELDRFDRTQNIAERQQLIGGALNNFMNQLGGGIGGGSMGGR